jgi:hypothetical protein
MAALLELKAVLQRFFDWGRNIFPSCGVIELRLRGLLGTFRMQRKTVLSEMSKPSIFSSPRMRGAPQVPGISSCCVAQAQQRIPHQR